ncbi:hypothetical protein GCM10023201_48250 [Actinomycetospora corticicola]|uniref:Uncharacterized protein n=1 Tax=Actinomycetospora corticicola TaxID=663602 RepID=A0A7Y9J7D2_9PSEU|nr:hypothetical protein [Actinomycetospora corticicola]NYD37911.1 hypothetical protein [Actinomycetospora corticicola]
MMASSGPHEEFEALVDMQVDLLRGRVSSAETVAQRLGLLAGFHLDQRGNWRPDGLCLVRRLLDELVGRWQRDPSGQRFYNGVRPDEVANVVRAMWGITRYPMSASGALDHVGVDVADRTADRWSRLVLRQCASKLGELTAVSSPQRIAHPGALRPCWGAQPAETWPPAGHDGRAANERGRLLWRARTHLEGFDALSDHELVALLRETVGERLLTYLSADAVAAPFRHARHHVIAQWNRVDPHAWHAPVPGPRVAKVTRDYVRAIPAISQMLFYEAVEDGASLRRTASGRLGVERFTASLPAITKGSLVAVRDLVVDGIDVREHPIVTCTPPPDSARRSWDGTDPESADGAEGYAAFIGTLAVADKRRYAHNYIATRPARVADICDERSAERIALADHRVQLNLVTTEDVPLIRALSRSMSEHPVHRRPELLAHRARAMIIMHNKANVPERAYRFGLHALASLREAVAAAAVDPIAEIEAAHQIDLALAGVHVRALERLFLERGPDRDGVARYARAALWWSSSALERLHFLARPDIRGGLPERHYTDGRIASRAWNVQTRLIWLRTLVAVRTALEAGLLVDDDLRRGRSGTLDVPGPSTDSLAQCELSCLRVLYREFVTRPEIGPAKQLEFTRTALWLALLDRGTLPLEQELAAGLKDLDFLDADPAGIGPGASGLVDITRLVEWLAAPGRTADAGVLSWLPESGKVYRTLDRTSEGRLRYFRSIERRPTVASHD